MQGLLEKTIEVRVDELSYGEVLQKQRSITQLFPSFKDRVKKVAASGGVRLRDVKPGLWHFQVASASEIGKRYDVYVFFKDIDAIIKRNVRDTRLWKKNRSGVDLRKLSVEVLAGVELELVCSCPADLYWGGQYIRTQRDAKYTAPETRPPVVRNPKQYGLMCKHLQLVIDVLPMYASTLASHLKQFYSKQIKDVEISVLKELGLVQQVAAALKVKQDAKKEEDIEVKKQQAAREMEELKTDKAEGEEDKEEDKKEDKEKETPEEDSDEVE